MRYILDVLGVWAVPLLIAIFMFPVVGFCVWLKMSEKEAEE